MDDLIEFLRARLDEDDRIARAATPGPWEWRQEHGGPWAPKPEGWLDYSGEYVAGAGGSATFFGPGMTPHADAVHVACHDPARVLADIDAKRAVVNAYEQAQAMKLASADNYKAWVNNDPLPHSQEAEGTEEMKLKAAGLSHAVRLLALPYADHPDYREEWRP